MSKLIPKHLTPANPLVLQNDNTRVKRLIEPEKVKVDWSKFSDEEVMQTLQEWINEANQQERERINNSSSERNSLTIYGTKNDITPDQAREYLSAGEVPVSEYFHNTLIGKGLSPVDPVGEFVVGNAVLGKPLQWLGKGLLYGFGRYAPKTKLGNWARAKLISDNMKTTQPQSGLAYYIKGNSSSTTSPKIGISEPFDYEAFNKQIMDVFSKRAKVRGGFDIRDIVEANGNLDAEKIARKILLEKTGKIDDVNLRSKVVEVLDNIEDMPAAAWPGLKVVHIDPLKLIDEFGPASLGYTRAHEYGHAFRLPAKPIPSGVLDFSTAPSWVKTYYSRGNNTEIAERFSQVLNFHGITDGRSFSPDKWHNMWKEYTNNVGKTALDNNITTDSFISYVRDWNKLCEWANDHKNVLSLGIPTTVIGINNTANENK